MKRKWIGFGLTFQRAEAVHAYTTAAFLVELFFYRDGLRWCDAPSEYGPPKTLYIRWKRWSDMDVFARIMMGLAEQAHDNNIIHSPLIETAFR